MKYILLTITYALSLNYNKLFVSCNFNCQCDSTSPDDWYEWTEWSRCVQPDKCIQGLRSRSREFNNIFCGECSDCVKYPHSCGEEQCGEPNNGCQQKCANNGICSCEQGFELGTDGKSCNDINECDKNKGGCDHTCHNSEGSYDCRCHDGYFLLADGKSCKPHNCTTLRPSDCPTDSYKDHLGDVCQKVSMSCSNGFEINTQCQLSCPDKFGLAKIQRVTGKLFAEDLSQASFDDTVTTSCVYNDGVKWSKNANEIAEYYCRRKEDPPRDVQVTSLSILEHAVINTEIGVVSSTHSSEVQYSIKTKGAVNFYIDGTILRNKKKFALMNINDNVKEIIIHAEDINNPLMYVSKSFQVTITNVNDPPENLTLSDNTYTDLSPAGYTIGTLTAVDYDRENPVQSSDFKWEITSGDKTMFDINENKLILKKKSSENKNSIYDIVIRCTDNDINNPQSTEKKFFLYHKNLNSHPVNLTVSLFDLYENAEEGKVIGLLKATDTDNDTIIFEELSGDNTFRINPVVCQHKGGSTVECQAEIKLLTSLNYEDKSEYSLTVKATDTKGEADIINEKIKVLDVNEKPTDIILSDYEFDENFDETGIEYSKRITVLDPDKAQKHSCQILDVDSPFKIISEYFTLNRTLDYESMKTHNVEVQCEDDGTPPLSFQKTIKIFVKDHNDRFEMPKYVHNENQPLYENQRNIQIGKIEIEDQDIKPNHICKVLPNQGEIFVSIEKSNTDGINYVKVLDVDLDFEMQQEITFSVECTDIGDQNYTRTLIDVVVPIHDVNETPLSPCTHSTFLSHETKPRTPVMTLISKDPDNQRFYEGLSKTPKQTLKYLLHSGMDFFEIQENDLLVLKKDLQKDSVINFQIQVVDDGQIIKDKNTGKTEQGKIESKIYTCQLYPVAPTDGRIPFVVTLSTNEIPENSKQNNLIGSFNVTAATLDLYRFSIYKQGVDLSREDTKMDLLKIESNSVKIQNPNGLNVDTMETYDMIVRSEKVDTKQVIYQTFQFSISAFCGELFRYNSEKCICKKNGFEGTKCDRNPSLCTTTNCAEDYVCSIFESSPQRCVPPENQLPVLLRSITYDKYMSSDEQYKVEEAVKDLLGNPDDNKIDYCNAPCTEEYFPQCGTDGRTYSNLCHLQNNAKCKQQDIKVAYQGKCKEECNGVCITVYEPVCGTDDVTYSNLCNLQVASKCNKPGLTLKYNGPCQTKRRKRRSTDTDDEIYIEATEPQKVEVSSGSFTYVKFIPTDEKSNYKFMPATDLCSRLENTQARCVNEADCKILVEAGIKCPYDFGNMITPGNDKKIGGSDGTPGWVWAPVAVGILIILIIVIVVLLIRRHKRPIKEAAPVTFTNNAASMQLGRNYSHIPTDGSPVKNNLNVEIPRSTQTMRDINALRRKTDITVFDNEIFSGQRADSFEISNPAYGARSANNRTYIDDPNNEKQENPYAHAENIYESVGKATPNPLKEKREKKQFDIDGNPIEDNYDKMEKKQFDIDGNPIEDNYDKMEKKQFDIDGNPIEDRYDKMDSVKRGNIKRDDSYDRIVANPHVVVDMPNEAKSVEDDKAKSVSAENLSEIEPELKPIQRGPSVNQFRPEDDEKDKNFKKTNLSES